MKFKSFMVAHSALVKDIAISTCLVGASAGIVFGVSAGMFHIEYMNLSGAEARLAASKSNPYYSENISSGWNMNDVIDPVTKKIITHGIDFDTVLDGRPLEQEIKSLKDWQAWHPDALAMPSDKADAMNIDLPEGIQEGLSDANKVARANFCSMVIDGATHTTMDRSFNQSLYEGLADFNQNIQCEPGTYSSENMDVTKYNSAKSAKPSQDNETEFVNTYMAIISQKENGTLGLAGFNHSSPLNRMLYHEIGEDGAFKPYAIASSPEATRITQKTGLILLDANCPNNQNVASVLFRADQPGFLSALAVCQYIYNNLHLYHDNFQDLAVAEFGGVAIPTVQIYLGGFQRGIELFNSIVLEDSVLVGSEKYYIGGEITNPRDIRCCKTFENLLNHSKLKGQIEEIKNDSSLTEWEKLDKFNETVYDNFIDEFAIKIIKLGGLSTHYTGTFVAGDAVGITKQYLNRGAAAIIAVAGPQSLDVAQEIQNQNSKCVVIGVDSAMEDGDYQRFHTGCSVENKGNPNFDDPYMDQTQAEDESRPTEANSIIKFSAIKDIKTISNKLNRLIAKGLNWDVSVSKNINGEDIPVPDPEKSICGPGFQTCCNIKNGLISISWDGFYPLLQVLQHGMFYLNRDAKDWHVFESSWKAVAFDYATEIKATDPDLLETIGTEYFPRYPDGSFNDTKGVFNINNLLTYRKTDENGEPTTYYKNYSHTMSILGRLLNTTYLNFSPDMTLDKKNGEYVIADSIKKLSILQWLDYNMYLMC